MSVGNDVYTSINDITCKDKAQGSTISYTITACIVIAALSSSWRLIRIFQVTSKIMLILVHFG